MRKISVFTITLILILISTIGTMQAKSNTEIAYDIVDLLEQSKNTLSKYTNDRISYKQVTEDFQDYSAKAKFIYIETLKSSNNKEFIKLTAGLTLTMDLYATGFNELSTDKIKTANKIFKYVLTPQIENIT